MPKIFHFFIPKYMAKFCRENSLDVCYQKYTVDEHGMRTIDIANSDDKMRWKEDESLVTKINRLNINDFRKYTHIVFYKDNSCDKEVIEKYLMGHILKKNSKHCIGTLVPILFVVTIILIYLFGLVGLRQNIIPLYLFGISALLIVPSALYVIFFYRHLSTTEQKNTSLRILEKEASDRWSFVLYRKNMLNIDEVIPLLLTSLFLILITFSFYTASLVGVSSKKIENISVLPQKDSD